MKNNYISMQAERLLKELRFRRSWKRIAACLSCFVVAITISALVLPAITLNEPECGLEEHSHSTQCYAPGAPVPVCSPTHVHDDSCKASDGSLDCRVADYVVHEHAGDCYDAQGNRVCKLTEVKEHTHGDGCYEVQQVVVDAGHTHSDECYTMVASAVPTCGKEETSGHTHDDTCKAVGTEQLCTKEETAGHTHGDTCRASEQKLVCEDVTEEHVHADGCYTTVEALVCTEAEVEAHTHDTACYAEAGSIICGKEEVPFHIHIEECYGLVRGDLLCTDTEREPVTQPGEKTLICDKDEVIVHTHTTPACYVESDGVKIWTCMLEEVTEHKHTADCMGTPDVLSCGKEEHVHDDSCVPTGDVQEETAEIWEATLPAELSGAWAEDLAAVALGQLSYTENTENVIVGEDGTSFSYTRYGAWAGTPYGEWHFRFIEFCLHYAGVSGNVLALGDSPAAWAANLQNTSYYAAADAAVPERGDIVFFDRNSDGSADRSAIVTTVSGDSLTAVEGNMDGAVAETTYALTDASILGFCKVNEAYIAVTTAEQQTYPVEVYSDSTYTQRDWGNKSLSIHGVLPEGVVVRAYPVEAEIADVTVTAAYALQAFTAESEPYALEQSVELMIEGLEDTKLWAIYTPDSEGGWTQAMSNSMDDREVKLSVSSFGTYAVVQTVDLMTVAETGDPEAIQRLAASGYFEYWQQFMNVGREVKQKALLAAGTFALGEGSSEQVDAKGGSVSGEAGDNISISKTIEGTDLENVFDITLEVNTALNVSEVMTDPDMAVVVVLDISNTMNSTFKSSGESITRYESAMRAAEAFIDKFAANNGGYSKIGFVSFNTHAHEVFPMQSCSTDKDATTLKNTVRTKTGNIIKADDYYASKARYTNIEGGLSRGYDMLKDLPNKHKYIIFISDGFPTTYLNKTKSNYRGYEPYSSSGTLGKDGVFHDASTGEYCASGVNYSDKGALYAQNMATTIKADGVEIFSVGVDIGGQLISDHLYNTTYSFVDCLNTSNFVIGGANDSNAYKSWLGNKIGSGNLNGYTHYYNSDKSAELINAFTSIFEDIMRTVTSSNQEKWITEDPLPVFDETNTDSDSIVEFIGYFDFMDSFLPYPDYKELIGDPMEIGENTARYDVATNTIHWDLKKSGYANYGVNEAGNNAYTYRMKYRVRLQNEVKSGIGETYKDFVENQIYFTNGDAELNYQILTIQNGVETFSPMKTIRFPMPSVHGYLGELVFKKVSESESPVNGAKFELTHDTEACGACRGDGTNSVDIAPFTAVSDANGLVSFAEIPSGHVYKMIETEIPDGYYGLDYTYQVVVSYDTVTVTELDANGTQTGYWNLSESEMSVVNYTGYQLPQTGGSGTWTYILGGFALMLTAGTMMVLKYKRRKGDAHY